MNAPASPCVTATARLDTVGTPGCAQHYPYQTVSPVLFEAVGGAVDLPPALGWLFRIRIDRGLYTGGWCV